MTPSNAWFAAKRISCLAWLRARDLHVGWMSAARQFSSAFAPFAFALMMSGTSVTGALLMLAISATAGAAAFTAVSRLAGSRSGLR